MSILINKAISKILNDSVQLKSKVGNNIYALVASENCTFPFVVFKRNNMTVEYNKDGVAHNMVDVQVIIGADTYSDSVEVAQIVRSELELKKGIFNGVKIIDSKITSVEEDYVNNSFAQSIIFSIKTE